MVYAEFDYHSLMKTVENPKIIFLKPSKEASIGILK